METCFLLQIGLYAADGGALRVYYITLLEAEAGAPTPLDLSDALPLDMLLFPLESCKELVIQAVDSLRPDNPSPSEASLDSDPAPASRLTRGLGGCLQVRLKQLRQAPYRRHPVLLKTFAHTALQLNRQRGRAVCLLGSSEIEAAGTARQRTHECLLSSQHAPHL